MKQMKILFARLTCNFLCNWSNLMILIGNWRWTCWLSNDAKIMGKDWIGAILNEIWLHISKYSINFCIIISLRFMITAAHTQVIKVIQLYKTQGKKTISVQRNQMKRIACVLKYLLVVIVHFRGTFLHYIFFYFCFF